MASEIERARTYRNYFHAFRTHCEHHGWGDIPDIKLQHDDLPWVQNAAMDAVISEDLRRHLFRGWLTLNTMKQLPLDDNPDLAIGASMWLPVQAYYACHGFGLAALCAIGMQMPDPAAHTHRKFLNMVSTNIVQPGILVSPFGMRCAGDCTLGHEAFHDAAVTPAQGAGCSNLAAPVTAGHAECLVAKCLKTTRREELLKRQRGRRRDLKKARLTQAEKLVICGNLPHTTCLDFLYRMRVCSNYEDADVFLFGQRQQEALEQCGRVIWFTRAVCIQFLNVLRCKLPQVDYTALVEQYNQAL